MGRQLSILLIFFAIVSVGTDLQADGPVRWAFDVTGDAHTGYTLTARATIPAGWHIYSQSIQEGGPIPTSIHFNATTATPVGKPAEHGNKHTFYSDTFDCEVSWFSGSAIFQRGFTPAGSSTEVQGYVEYLACDDYTCVPAKISFRVSYP